MSLSRGLLKELRMRLEACTISIHRLLPVCGFVLGVLLADTGWGQTKSEDKEYGEFKEVLKESELQALKASLRRRRPEWLLQAELESIGAALDGTERELEEVRKRIKRRDAGQNYATLTKEALACLARARKSYSQYETLAKGQQQLTDRLLSLQKLRPKQGPALLARFEELQKKAGVLGHSILELDEEVRLARVPLLTKLLRTSEISLAQVVELKGEELFILGCNFVDRGWLGRAKNECFGPLSKGSGGGRSRRPEIAQVASLLAEEVGTDKTQGLEAFSKLGNLGSEVRAHQWLICLAARVARQHPADAQSKVAADMARALVAKESLLDRIRGTEKALLRSKAELEMLLLRRKVFPWRRNAPGDIKAFRNALSEAHSYWLLAELRLIELGQQAYGTGVPEPAVWKKILKESGAEVERYQGAGLDSALAGADLIRAGNFLGELVEAARGGVKGLKSWRKGSNKPIRTAFIPDVRTGSRADFGALVRRIYEPEIAKAANEWMTSARPAEGSAEEQAKREADREKAFDVAFGLVQDAKVLTVGMPTPAVVTAAQLAEQGDFKVQHQSWLKNQVLLEFFVGEKQTWVFALFADGKKRFASLITLHAPLAGEEKRGALWWLPEREQLSQRKDLSILVAPDGGLCYYGFGAEVLKDAALSKNTRAVEFVPTIAFYAKKWPLFDPEHPEGRTFTSDLMLDVWGQGAAIRGVRPPVLGENLVISRRRLLVFLQASGGELDKQTRDLASRSVEDAAALFKYQRDEKKLTDIIAVRYNR